MMYFELRRWTSRFLMILAGLAVLLFGAVDTTVAVAIEAAVFLLALFWVARRIRRPYTLLWTALYTPFALVAGVGVYQVTTGITVLPYATTGSVALWLTYWIFFALALHCHADPWIRQESTYWLASGGGILGLLAIGQAVLNPAAALTLRVAPGANPLGPFAQVEHLTVVFELLIPVTLLAASEDARRVWRWYLSAAVMATAVVIGGSRIGLAIVGAEVLVFGALQLLRLRRELRRDAGQALTALTGLTLSALIILVGAMISPPSRAATTLRASVSLADSQVRAATEQMFREEPSLGHGLGAFAAAFPKFAPVEQRARWAHLESDPVEMALELGVAGAACQALFAGLALLLSIGLGRRAWLGALLPLTGAWLHSWTSFPFEVPAVAFVALLLLAQIPAEGMRRTRRRKRIDGAPIGPPRGAPIY